MTAGIAATRPSAVANSASAMPGATTARLVFFCAAIAVKAFMMPQTVPNRPTKGAVEPTVARKPVKRSSRSISRVKRHLHDALDALLQARAPPPSAALRRPSVPERRHSRIAELNIADIGSDGRSPTRS